jgi:hypothetical protein
MEQQILDRLERIEKNIAKIEPLVDLLQMIIKNNLKNINSQVETTQVETTQVETTPPELMYTRDGDTIYISGTKTYDNRDMIKATFKGASWNKEKTAWAFKYFEDFETVVSGVFPNIIKGQ